MILDILCILKKVPQGTIRGGGRGEAGEAVVESLAVRAMLGTLYTVRDLVRDLVGDLVR